LTGRSNLGPAFRGLWMSAGLSNLADGVLQLSLPLLALQLTGSASAVAGVAVALGLPWLLLAMHAGVVADRLDRRRVMVGVQLGRVGVIAVLAILVATDNDGIWLLYGVAFVLGALETLFDTTAQTMMPAVVAASELTRANGRLFTAQTVANEFVGPPLGGALASVGIALSLGASAACFFLAAVVLAGIPGSFRATRTTPPARVRDDIAEGLRFLWRHPLLRRLTVISAVSNCAISGAFALLPALAVSPGPMGLSEFGVGVVLTSFAVGGLVASLTVVPLERALGRWRLLVVCVVADGASLALLATAEVAVAVAVGLVFGAGIVYWNVLLITLRQRVIPDHLLGRVNAAIRTVTWGAMPFGAAIAAAAVQVVDVTTVFAWCGIAAALLALLLRGCADDVMDDTERAALAVSPA